MQLIDEEITQFEESHKRPKSGVTNAYCRKMDSAKSKLISVYQSAVKDLTKSGDIEQAKSVQATLDRLMSAKVAVPRDAIRNGHLRSKHFLIN